MVPFCVKMWGWRGGGVKIGLVLLYCTNHGRGRMIVLELLGFTLKISAMRGKFFSLPYIRVLL